MEVIGDRIYGLCCPKCRLSSENMELPKADAESGAKLLCPECEVELVTDTRARPVFQSMRCMACNIGVAKTRKQVCHYCGGPLVPDTKNANETPQQPLTTEPKPRS